MVLFNINLTSMYANIHAGNCVNWEDRYKEVDLSRVISTLVLLGFMVTSQTYEAVVNVYNQYLLVLFSVITRDG